MVSVSASSAMLCRCRAGWFSGPSRNGPNEKGISDDPRFLAGESLRPVREEALESRLIARMGPLAATLPQTPRPTAHAYERRGVVNRQPELAALPTKPGRQIILLPALKLGLRRP
jgi:hypothetical protein